MRKHNDNVWCTMRDILCKKVVARTGKLSFYVSCFTFCILHFTAAAQKANKTIQQGNDAYRKADFTTAIQEYTKALSADAKNAIARFNMANAFQHSNEAAKAAQAYDDAIKNTPDGDLQSKAYYNKGLSMLQQKDLAGAIDAFKQSLRLAPNDSDARDNLQKAMEEMKQQQAQPQQQDQKPPPRQQPPKKQKQPPKMNQQMMEQKFKELQDQEKQLQRELQKQKTNQRDNEQDW